MASELFYLPGRSAINLSGFVASGAVLSFFETGTSTPLAVYSNAGLTSSLGTTVTANAAGKFPDIYLDDAEIYRVRCVQNGVTLFDVDPYYPGSAAEATDELIEASLEAQIAADIALAASGPIYATTAAGIAAVADGATFTVSPDPVAGTAGVYRRSGASAMRLYRIPTNETTVALPQSQRLYNALVTGQDCNIVVATDSTGDATNEWPYQLGVNLAARFPTHTVKWRPWSSTEYPAGSEVTIATGTGSATLIIWSAAVAGSIANLHSGGLFRTVFEPTGAEVDLIYVSYSLNGGSGVRQMGYIGALLARMGRELPNVPVVLIGQNPTRDDTTQAEKVQKIRQVAGRYGAGFIDIHRAFLTAPTPLSQYFADSVHPNAAGQQLYVENISASINPGTGNLAASRTPTAVIRAYHSVAELAVSSLSNATLTRTTTVNEYETAGEGAVLTSTAATGWISLPLLDSSNILALRGQWVTFAARIEVPSGNSGESGRIEISDGVTTSLPTYVTRGNGFVWAVVTHRVNAAATGLTGFLYPGVSGTPGESIKIDRVILATGTEVVDVLPTLAQGTASINVTGANASGAPARFSNSATSAAVIRVFLNGQAVEAEWLSGLYNDGVSFKQAADAEARSELRTVGGLRFGSGSAATDMGIDRQLAGIMRFTGADLWPDNHNSRYLGSGTKSWRGLFVAGSGAGDGIFVNNVRVLGAQGAAVADASGGATVDSEARTAINTLLARLRAHGIIAT